MRNLFIIRHAKSSWDISGLPDAERPLNPRGLQDAPRMAALLKGMDVRPDLLVSSPARRAISTAVFFADAFGIDRASIEQIDAVYESSPATLQRIISQLPDTAYTVLLFGHNPTITELVNQYSDALIENVPTCGVVCLASTAPSWSELYEGNTRVTHTWFPKIAL
jgi:phosphohistidine phosphatase